MATVFTMWARCTTASQPVARHRTAALPQTIASKWAPRARKRSTTRPISSSTVSVRRGATKLLIRHAVRLGGILVDAVPVDD
jgi:hypothetical protein